MKGFTLVEILVVLLVTTIVAGISFQFAVFNPETLYLKNFVYKLTSNLNLLKDLSLGRRLISSDLKVCGYGLVIANKEYYGYAYATSTIFDCDFLASSTPLSFVPSSPLYYVHTNGDIRQDPIENLQVKDKFKTALTTDYLKISTSSENCNDDLSSYDEISLVYYNPYGELLLLGKKNTNWENLLTSDWNEIYICLKYKNEERKLVINRSGQLLVRNVR